MRLNNINENIWEGMTLKSCKGIAVAAALFVVLAGCDKEATNEERPTQEPVQSSSSPTVNLPTPSPAPEVITDEDGTIIVDNAGELGPGPLTKANSSIGGIHIGDTLEQVRKLLGEPDEIKSAHGTGELQWFYEKENTYIFFYRESEKGPVEGVSGIKIVGPSALKNEKGIGIGDSVEKLIENYTPLGKGSRGIGYWVMGKNYNEGYYHPKYLFLLDSEKKIQSMDLGNSLIDPAITE